MPAVKFFRGTAATAHQRQSQRIAQGYLQSGGRGGSTVQRIGFRHERQQEGMRGVFAEQTVRVARHAYQRNISPHGIQHDVREFRRIAGIGKGQNRVAGGKHAQVAVAGFAGMNEIGRRTRGCQSGRHLAGHMTAFAHARDRDAAFDVVQAIHNVAECGIEAARH